MTTATTKVEVETDTEQFRELQRREPEKTPDEIVESALELYRVTHSPWVSLKEAEEFGGDA